MKKKIILTAFVLLAVCGISRAQWVVTDPVNLAQGIVNSINEIVETSSTATNMINTFQEAKRIYQQGKDYYDKLRAVTDLVRNARKVQQCMLLVGEISELYVNAYERMLSDEHFSVGELSSIAVGYSKLIREATDELKDLKDIVNPTDMSLTDKDRLDVIEQVYNKLLRIRNLTAYYTRKNISVSLLRARKADNLERTLQLYGSDDERYW